MGSCEASCGNAEGRTAHIVQAKFVAELNAIGVASMLPTDTELNVAATFSAFLHGNFHELADSGLVHASEGILAKDVQFGVIRKEAARVVTAHAEGSLSEIVRAETEELGSLGDCVRS